METFKQRLKRYTDENDLEIFGWLTIFLQNAYLREIQVAKEARLYHCMYLITHAVIQMVSENMFGFKGKDGTRFYLESFIDGNTQDRQFSLVTDEIHDARNVMVHQGYSSLQHRVEYFNDEMPEGWKKEADATHINPAIYADQFENAFSSGALIQKYQQLTDKVRVIRKYQYIRQWLRLDKTNPIFPEIKKLEACTSMQGIRTQEVVIQRIIYAAYNLT